MLHGKTGVWRRQPKKALLYATVRGARKSFLAALVFGGQSQGAESEWVNSRVTSMGLLVEIQISE